MKTFTFRFLPCLLLMVSFLPVQSMADQGPFIELIVAKGDNLNTICGKYLEQPAQWPVIGRINMLKNYDRIRPGQKLFIPVKLLRGAPSNGRVVHASGDVAIRPDRASPWTVCKRDDQVRQGSIIKTGNNSAVEITFNDGTTIIQRENTILDVRRSEQKGNNYIVRKMKLSTGRILTRVRRATGKDVRFEIQTPSATAAARGTDYRMSSGPRGDTASEVLQGVVHVASNGRIVTVREGEGTHVIKGGQPIEPRKLLSPPAPLAMKTAFNSLPISLDFERVEGAVAYRFSLSRDREGKEPVHDKVYRIGEPAMVSDLEDGDYYGESLSIDGLGIEGLPSPLLPLTVRTHPLPPYMQQPAEGARYKGYTLNCRWLQVPDAVRYQVQIARDREFRQETQEPQEVKGTEYTHEFDTLGDHYFRIRSVAEDGYAGAWSDTVSFSMTPPPPAPEMEKPELDGSELQIRWKNQGEKKGYHCQVSMDKDFKNPIIDRKLDRPELIMATPKIAGVYYVRTSTIDPDGTEGRYSPPQIFEIKSRWPYVTGAIGIVGVLLLILL